MQAPFFISVTSMRRGLYAISAIIWLLFDQIGQFLISLESMSWRLFKWQVEVDQKVQAISR